ncbi:hypothetical protein NEDG_00574 [Nematocida displodere]|uniref:Uncharacterized protein n=1 Tax=Nematocida displodere TaxID=1805483 RepID=A0A177ED36_9MICR|nr:hypothetical protein NEDG_00574 [Nematocida displodere]
MAQRGNTDDSFPVEALGLVSKHLDIDDIKRLMVSSKTLKKRIENSPIIWKRYMESSHRERSGKYVQAVKKEYLLARSWMRARETERKSVKYIAAAEVTKMEVFGDILVVSSTLYSVAVYDHHLNHLQTLSGHRGSVWTFDYKDSLLVTGSTDRTAKIWDCFLGLCVKTLVGHTSTIRCIKIAEGYIITGSRDHTIRVWDIKTGACKHVLTGHTDSVRDLALVENMPMCVSASYDGAAILWNYRTGEGVRCLIKLPRRMYAVCVSDGQIATGGMDQILNVLSADGRSLFKSKDHTSTIFNIQRDKTNGVYTLTTDGTLSRWDLQKKELTYTIETLSKVVGFCVLDHLVVIGTSSKILLYKKYSGVYVRAIETVSQLYTLSATEDALFFASKTAAPSLSTEIHTLHFKR